MNVMASALPVALEHIRYCRRQGMGCLAILRDAEIRLTDGVTPSWDDTVWLIARKWMSIANRDSEAA
jgi:hypothetical protein